MPNIPWRIRTTDTALEVTLHVQTRARSNEIIGYHDGALKLKVSAPPVENAANRAIVEFFANLLDIARSRIRIVSGGKSRDKVLRIEGFSLEAFQSRIDAAMPKKHGNAV